MYLTDYGKCVKLGHEIGFCTNPVFYTGYKSYGGGTVSYPIYDIEMQMEDFSAEILEEYRSKHENVFVTSIHNGEDTYFKEIDVICISQKVYYRSKD